MRLLKRFLIASLSILLLSFVSINFTLAAARQLEVPFTIPGVGTITALPVLPVYISLLFKYTLGVVGVICLASLIYGGFRYITSVGSPVAMSDAKDRMYSALLGLVILFCAYLILNTINPELVILNLTPSGGCTTNDECPKGNDCICVGSVPVPCPAGKEGVCIASVVPNNWTSGATCSALNYKDDCEKYTDKESGNPFCYWCPHCSGSKENSYGTDKCIQYTIKDKCTYTSTDSTNCK
jgi:hypothetical protein